MPYITTDTHKICYEAYGASKHPCIVLVPGINGQLIHWPKSFIKVLVNSGFYIIAFDNRDAGLSQHYDHMDAPEIMHAIELIQAGNTLTPPYKLDDMAADMDILIHQLGISKAHIIGISMGGMIAQIFADQYPEKTLSLSCIASTSGEPGLPPAKQQVMDFFFSAKRNSNDIDDYMNDKIALYKIYNHPDYFNEDQIRGILQLAYERDHNASGFKRQMLAIIAAQPRSEILHKLNLPCLIIHGEYDPAFPIEHGRQLASCIAGSDFIAIEKLGHGLPEGLCQEIGDIIAAFIHKSKKADD